MGPRTLVRGNRQRMASKVPRHKLQWGRALSCAEISCGDWHPCPATHCFNGAAHSRARKYGDHGIRTHIAACFNGAAHSRARKSTSAEFALTAATAASMGPRTLVRGNPAEVK